MTDATDSGETEHDEAQTHNYEPLESAIDTAQALFEPIEDGVGELYEGDVEDLEERLEAIEDAVDSAQDSDDFSHLSRVPALVDYVQVLTGILAEQTDSAEEAFEEFAVAVEAVEDHLEDFNVDRALWFAQVNGVPLLYEERVVEARRLINDAMDPDDPSDYTLEAYTSTVDDEPDRQYPRPEHEVDLGDFDVFRTARDKGGGPV